MIGSKLRQILTTAAAGAMVMVAVPVIAQAPPGGGPPRGGMGGMGLMGGPVDRPTMIQRLALDDAALKLTAAQQTQIDKLVDGFIAEQGKLREKNPMTPGSPPNPEMMTAMRAAREGLNTEVGKVLNDGQRTTWQAAMAARRPAGPPGGGPGGMGGMGGPPPAK
jgi:hypothetical protein